MTSPDHWNAVYDNKAPDRVSWYTPHLERSLDLILGLGLPPAARIIDVGAGAATLTGDLLQHGFVRPTVLDISASAIRVAKDQLGRRAQDVDWLVGDITRLPLPQAAFDVWHDRAVFHFLTNPDARDRYVKAVRRALKPGGHAIVATFGLEGPEQCSGLTVARYDETSLHAAFGAPFIKIKSHVERHQTPWGAEQEFVYCLCRTA